MLSLSYIHSGLTLHLKNLLSKLGYFTNFMKICQNIFSLDSKLSCPAVMPSHLSILGKQFPIPVAAGRFYEHIEHICFTVPIHAINTLSIQDWIEFSYPNIKTSKIYPNIKTSKIYIHIKTSKIYIYYINAGTTIKQFVFYCSIFSNIFQNDLYHVCCSNT